MASSTTELNVKVTADARSAVSGLAPLESALTDVAASSESASSALAGLAGEHRVNVDDAEIKAVSEEIARLRTQMREGLRADPTMDTAVIRRQISGLRTTLKELNRPVEIPVQIENVDSVTSGERAISDLGRVAATTFPSLNNVGFALTSVGKVSPIVKAGVAGIGAAFGSWKLAGLAADVQTTQLQLKALTGSTELAAQTFADLQKFAADTPFELDQVTAAARNLLIAGNQPSELPELLTSLGNVAATAGQPIQDVATIFQQMQTKGKVANEELLQLTERAIPAYQVLADQLGVTVAQVQKMASEGKIGADQIKPLIASLGEMFPTAMADQAASFNGQLSTLHDTAMQLGQGLGSEVLPEFQSLLGLLQTTLDVVAKLPAPVKAIGIAFATASIGQKVFGGTLEKMGSSLGALRTKIGGATGVVSKLKIGLGGIVSLFDPWVLAITAGVAVLTLWSKKQQEAKKRVDELSAGIDGQTGKLNENGKAILANDIADWADDMAKAGVSATDVTTAILGSNDAFDAQISALHGVADAHSSFHSIAGRGGVSSTAQVFDDTGNAAMALITNMQGLRGTYGQASDKAKDVADAQDAVTVATTGVTQSMTQLNTTVTDTAKAYQDALTNFSAFNDALAGNLSTIYDYQGGLDDLGASLEKGSTFAPGVEQGRKNWDALVKVGQTASDRIASVLKTRGAAAALTVYQNSRETLHRMLVNAGVQSSRAWTLVNDVLKKPHTMHVELSKVDTAKINADLARLNKRKAKIQADFDIPPDVINQRIAGATQKMQARLKPIDAKINADVQKLEPAKRNLDNAANPNSKARDAKITTHLDPSSYSAAKSDLDALTAPATKIIKVHMQENPTGDPIDPNSFLQNTTGALTLNLAPGGSTTTTAQPETVQLAPRTTPVKVFLDGAEIADHLTLKANRLATTALARRP